MPSTNWNGTYAAIAVIALVVGAFSILLWDVSGDQTEARVLREQNARLHTEYGQDRIEQACRNLDSQALIRCVATEIASSKDHGRAESDLDAQQAMALWAKLMTLFSILGLAVTSIGVYLVWRTLGQTMAATKAAQDAVIVTREMGERQIRAYVSAGYVSASNIGVGSVPEFSIKLNNNGQTPALRCTVRATVFMAPGNGDNVAIRIAPANPRGSMTYIAAGSEVLIKRKMSIALDKKDLTLLSVGVYKFVFAGYVIYRDVFGKTRRTTFKMDSQNFTVGAGDIQFRICSKGNNSS